MKAADLSISPVYTAGAGIVSVLRYHYIVLLNPQSLSAMGKMALFLGCIHVTASWAR